MNRSRARLAGVALLLGAGLGLAGCFNFEVTKEVTGGQSVGPFTVEVTCNNQFVGTESDTLTFNGPGTESTVDFASIAGGATCLIAETDTAGAVTVELACSAPIPAGVVCNSTPGGLLVAVPDEFEDTIGISVVNDFTPPTTTPPPSDPGVPASPVVGRPTFTG